MHKNRLSLVRPRRRGVPSAHPIGYTYKVSKARTPHEGRAFAHPMHFKCRNALSNTESVSRSVQILDLYPRLASTDRVSERKIRGRIFRPANTWCNNLFIFTETL